MANEKFIWDYLIQELKNPFGVAGLMGNLYAESGLISNRVQGDFGVDYDCSREYTFKVDSGIVSEYEFIHGGPNGGGYGLAQWTYWSRKKGLIAYAKSTKRSIGDLQMQLEFLLIELAQSFSGVFSDLKNAKSVLEASNSVLLKFERPADQSVSMQNKRATYSQKYYDEFVNSAPSCDQEYDMTVEEFKVLWSEMRKSLQDNDASEYSESARIWAVSTGLIQGGDSGEFNGMWQDLLTREQMVTILYRYFNMINV